jgi:hypothetical protein
VKVLAHRAGLPGHAVASKTRATEVSFIGCPFLPVHGVLCNLVRIDPALSTKQITPFLRKVGYNKFLLCLS